MTQSLRDAALALQAGDKASARRLLSGMLKTNPTADAWYLAAHATDDPAVQIRCLKKALALDEWHSKANRMLAQLEIPPPLVDTHPPGQITRQAAYTPQGVEAAVLASAAPASAPSMDEPSFMREAVTIVGEPATTPEDLLAVRLPPRKRKRKGNGNGMRRIGCVLSLLMMSGFSLLVLSLTGFIPGGVALLEQLTGGPPPVEEVDGIPIANNPNAIYLLEPSQSQPAITQQQDAIDHGYLHEYTFEARAGEEVVIFVQFLSVGAGNVSANVAVVDPDGVGVNHEVCNNMGEQGFVMGDSNVTLQCLIDMAGTWSVRILGISGETTGTYFLGVESLTDLR